MLLFIVITSFTHITITDIEIMKRSLVSVVIPVYNSAVYLSDAINSILNQTHENLELILIDDCSTDDSKHILKEFAQQDRRIKVYENITNLGPYASRNIGIENATGDFIAGMDADDLSLLDRLKTQYEFLLENPDIGLCGSWVATLGLKKDVIWKYPENDMAIRCRLLFSNPIACPTFFIRKSILDSYGLQFNSHNRIAEDYLFWAKLLSYTKAANIQKPLVRYRLHSNQISSKRKTDQNNVSLLLHQVLLRNLGIEFTYRDLVIHEMLANYELFETENVLEEIEKWLRKLLLANEVSNVYDSQFFKQELLSRWSYACMNVKMNKRNTRTITESPFDLTGRYSSNRSLFVLNRIFHTIIKKLKNIV